MIPTDDIYKRTQEAVLVVKTWLLLKKIHDQSKSSFKLFKHSEEENYAARSTLRLKLESDIKLKAADPKETITEGISHNVWPSL